MKTLPHLKPFLVVLLLAGVISVLLLFVNGCKHKKAPPADAAVNPAFEMLPPIARSVDIQRIEGNDNGNVLLTADFGRGVLTTPFHAVMLGEEKIVLRDDGKEGDAVAGDGNYSVLLEEDTTAIQQELAVTSRQLGEKKFITVFHNRVMEQVAVNPKTRDELKQFAFGGVLHFNPGIFNLLVAQELKDHSLTITAQPVVEDSTRTFNPCSGVGNPLGAWTFAKLVTEMANTPLTGVQPKDFLLNWLETWSNDQLVNGDLIAARTKISNIIDAWKALSGGSFDIKFAPFKLLAIVNRVDLRGNSGYGFANPGEGRFVFCAVDSFCRVIETPAPFMVIFEYGIPKHRCADLKAYAQQWYNLKGLTVGSPAYNAALQAITDQFTLANTSSSKPNRSSINQVRTNEFALAVQFPFQPWELREFNIDSATHLLKNVTVKQEPQDTFNRISLVTNPAYVQVLADFVNNNTADVEANRYSIPLTSGGKNFAGGKAHTQDPVTFHWDGSASPGPQFINSDSARFILSINTCSGCHGGESRTGNFMHVAPGITSSGVPALLSPFLTGDPAFSTSPFLVSDPAGRPGGSPRVRGFNDLERRALDLEAFVSSSCVVRVKAFALAQLLTFDPIRMTH
ncbi:MAG TPA: choice-of-anchor X domain-containing protein [Chitinophagaceae bacterium]|jgi:hypothetical protein